MKTTNQPEIINGVFTVNAEGKKVKFAKGNLFWDGKEFRCEKNQYDYPKKWKPEHVGYFLWSKSKDVTVTKKFSDKKWDNASTTDKFFATDGGAIEGYTVLSKEEWNYVFNNHLGKRKANVAGINCIVLVPDNFNGTIANSYTAEEWANAESQYGLVALPFAGNRDSSSIVGDDSFGNYWSGTPFSDNSDLAYRAYFDSSDAYSVWSPRDYGYSVRLVSVQDIPVTEKQKTETKKAKQFNLTSTNSEFDVVSIDNAQDAVDYARQFYGDDIAIYESAFIILLNLQNKTIGWAKISQGGCSATIMDRKMICKYALESLASGVILIHNHPSGNQKPSLPDVSETKELKDALSLFDIQLVDHIILTEDNYYSFSEI